MTVSNVTIRQLQDSVEAYRRLLSTTNQKAEETQRQLIRIGLEVCGGQMDQLQKSGVILEEASPETLGNLIMGSLKIHYPTSQMQHTNWPERLNELKRKIDSLQKEVSAQTQRANLAEGKALQLQKQVEVYEQTMIEERQKNQKNISPSLVSSLSGTQNAEWFESWTRSKGFDRDKQVVLVLGETGYSRVTEIRGLLVKKFSLSERTAYHGIESCVKEGLIERGKGTSIEGRPPDLIVFTERGKWAYTKLSGQRPAVGELEVLMKSHKSKFHTLLILKTADCFTTLGYEVDREPIKIKIEENRYFLPDLVARKDNDVYYLEVETGEREDRESLVHKWENAFVAGAGRICVVASKPGVMTTIQSRILDWATENGKKLNLYLTHIESLRSRRPGESPWVRVR
jgi:hypothetical protein